MYETNMDRDAVVSELKAKLAYRNIQYSAHCNYIDRLNETIHLMKTSSSWQITKPFRKLVEMFGRKV